MVFLSIIVKSSIGSSISLVDKYKYLLCDNNKDIEEYKDEYYPENEYFIKNKHHVILNYNTNYSILDLILMFFMASFGGWLWEVFFNYINYYINWIFISIYRL